ECGVCEYPTDADYDGVPDYADLDDDGDTILDREEGVDDADGDGTRNDRDLDSDGDCIPDLIEAGDFDLDTSATDSDGDGVPDYLDTDSDEDGVSDTEEVGENCLNPDDLDEDGTVDHLDDDTDGDGLTDLDEAALETDSRERDSDGDGYTDGLEDYAGTDPLDADDVPDGIVVTTGPRQVTEVTTDYTRDQFKVDVFIVLDTAYSYSCYHPDLPSFIEDMVDAVFPAYDNAAVGFGTYDDYTDWAATGGHPFKLRHQVSTDQNSVKLAAAGQSMVYGGNGYGSAYEALFQSVTGVGYDNSCDGTYDDSTDIQPFIPDSTDAFEGSAMGSYDDTIGGTGDVPGVGWRTGANKVVILAADNTIRDPDSGHDVPSAGCFDPPGLAKAAEAAIEANIKVLGVNVYEYQSSDNTLQQQLEDLAVASDSFLDRDGDGTYDDPAVLYGSWDWPSTSEVTGALESLVADSGADIWFQQGEDEYGWISTVDDTIYEDVQSEETVDFGFEVTTAAKVKADDQFYQATLEVVSDDGVLDEVDVWLLIRPETQQY
ncbi:MAG: hypothetical protein QGG40_14650, partial [Myxococcota bacterium]|nr:hypothetical protein [Myxococcota bacterium]